ncbi:MAG: O-antigen ligase family protein [Marinicellaceae bacterium]
MKFNNPVLVFILFISVLVLLPFSRLSELPILLLSIIGLIGLFKHRKRLINNPAFSFLSVVYACYFTMILFSATDSYWQNKTLIVGIASLRFYLSTIALILYFKKSHCELLIKCIAGLMIFWSLDAIFQYLVGVDIIGRSSYEGRLNGIFGEQQVKLGPVLALFFPAVLITLKTHKQVFRWFFTVAVIITIILTGTRSAWIMVLFTLMAYWFHHVKHRRFVLLFKTLIATMVIVTSLWFMSPDFKNRVDRTVSAFDGSVSGLDFALANRLPIWQASVSMIQQHPINGVGAHAFRKAYPDFASDGDIWQKNGGVGMHAHHWFLEILSDTGIIGLILFIIALIQLIKYTRTHYNQDYSWVFVIALISAFLPITSTYSIFASFWSICIWFCGAGLIIMSKNNE